MRTSGVESGGRLRGRERGREEERHRGLVEEKGAGSELELELGPRLRSVGGEEGVPERGGRQELGEGGVGRLPQPRPPHAAALQPPRQLEPPPVVAEQRRHRRRRDHRRGPEGRPAFGEGRNSNYVCRGLSSPYVRTGPY